MVLGTRRVEWGTQKDIPLPPWPPPLHPPCSVYLVAASPGGLCQAELGRPEVKLS